MGPPGFQGLVDGYQEHQRTTSFFCFVCGRGGGLLGKKKENHKQYCPQHHWRGQDVNGTGLGLHMFPFLECQEFLGLSKAWLYTYRKHQLSGILSKGRLSFRLAFTTRAEPKTLGTSKP